MVKTNLLFFKHGSLFFVKVRKLKFKNIVYSIYPCWFSVTTFYLNLNSALVGKWFSDDSEEFAL